MREFIKNHFDFKIYPVTWIAILSALIIIPGLKYLPIEFGYENGVLENLQMLFLFISLFLAFNARTNKKFFIFIGLVVTIIMLREIYCGRTLFFPVPGEINHFYSWKDIKYGYLAHPLYGLYMGCVGLYFILNKLYLDFWNIIKRIKFPVWNIVLLIIGMAVGMYAEKCLENAILEELGELLFYVSLTGIIWLYGFNKKFID